ncbi:hypothetical protein LG047_14290 [Methylocystis sp. WRRC1]|uniref:hypothetical protein n=1 Tax=unclassified Methylocystis TaxID=2625913 RepID=UPI0001F87E32|nr:MULTISPECIES: hypothetical protein [unclassified Methylocystis]MCC3246472.1 hypothetical protein [Methylocystis sp. WRRC1]
MKKILTAIAALVLLAATSIPADAWVRGPGVGVGRPGARGFGGVGGPGRVGVGPGLPGRPTPYRPYVGRVYR